MKLFITTLFFILTVTSCARSSRRKLTTIPKAMCGPAAAGTKAMIDRTVDCATKKVVPGMIINGLKHIGAWKIVDKKRMELAGYVANALVIKLGCPANKRRLLLGNLIYNAVSSIGGMAYDFGHWMGCQVYGVACYLVTPSIEPACTFATRVLMDKAAAYHIPKACVEDGVKAACMAACGNACEK